MYLQLFPHLMHRCMLASAHHSVRCFVSHSSCQRKSTHLAVKAGRVLQNRVNFLSFLLDCPCSHFRHKSFVQHCSCFLPAHPPVDALSDELLKARHLFLFLLCAVCLDMLHFHHKISCGKTVQFFPNLDSQISISSSRFDAFSFSPPHHINNSSVVHMHLDGSNHCLEKA